MKTLLLITLLISGKAEALLSPLNQSIREIKELLNSPEIAKLDQSEPIESVIRTEEGFIITTPTEEIEAEIHYTESDRIGPRPFSFTFKDH